MTKMDVNNAHKLYSHIDNQMLNNICKLMNIILTRTKRTCKACAYAKAKSRAVPKKAYNKSIKKGERLFVGISGPYKKSLVGSEYWVLIIDDFTRKCWSFFIKKKHIIDEVLKRFI